MALQKQFHRVNMGQGLDTKTDPKVLSSGKMVVLQNAKFSSTNRLSKRDGFVAVGTTDSSGASVQRLAAVNGNVIGWGNPGNGNPRSIYTYNESITTPTFSPIRPGTTTSYRAACNDCAVTIRPSIHNNSPAQQADSASANGFTVYAETVVDAPNAINSVVYWVVDQVTGNVVIANTLLNNVAAGTISVRCIANGGYLLIGMSEDPAASGLSRIQVTSISTAGTLPTVSHTFTTFSVTGSVAWDWSSHTFSGTTGVFLAYQSTTNTVKVALINPQAVAVATASYTIGAVTIAALCCVSPVPGTTSTTLRVVVGDTASNFHYAPFNVSLTAGTFTASSTTALVNFPRVMIGQELSTGASQVFVTSQTTNVYNQATVAWGINTSGTFASQVISLAYTNSIKAFGIYSKPIYVSDSQIYFWTLYPSLLQGQLVMFQWTPNGSLSQFYPTARVAVGAAVGDATVSTTAYGGTSLAVNTYSITTSIYANSCMIVDNQFTNNGVIQQKGVSQVVSDFTFGNSYQVSEMNNQSIIAGGFNAVFDGQSPLPFELGYFTYPEYLTGTPQAAGGSMAAATYQYIAVYEWTDGRGNIHQSETSVPLTTTLSGTQASAIISLGGPGNSFGFFPPFTMKGFGMLADAIPRTVFYRTTGNANPLIFFRVGDDGCTGKGTITDTLADASITGNEIIYIQGGVEDNFTVDGTTVICATPDRLFAADPRDYGIVHVGKPYTETVGLAFFAGINIQLPTEDGPVTNMLYMDSTLVIFKARSIYAVSGIGPTPNGQNNGLSPAQRISNDVGCDNPHAATLYPDGIMFKSAKGYYRLGHDLSFAPASNYVGSGVETFNSLGCLRACARQDLNQCRFVLSDNQTILCYDYLYQQWSTIQTSVTDIVSTGSAFYVASNTPSIGGFVAQESVGAFTDALTNPTGIPFTITLGWIALNQLQGCQRVYRARFLGDLKSSHTLKVEFAYDYESSFNESHTITSTNITTGNSAYQCEAFPLRQKCEAIQIRISDPTPTGESFDLTDIELEVGILPGRRFPLAAQKGF